MIVRNLTESTESLKIINGDVFNEIKKIASNSVHLICTDPPYFISRKTNFKEGGGDQKKYGSISMEFGEWDLKVNTIDYRKFIGFEIDEAYFHKASVFLNKDTDS